MESKYLMFGVVCIAVTLASLPAEARKYSYDDVNHGINIYYGEVSHIERAETNKRAKQGAMIGGLAGFAYGTHRDHHRTKDTVAGALAGALIGAIVDSAQKHTYAYRVRLGDGHDIEVVSENSGGLQVGDCVAVEEGRRVNIRRVSDSYCRDHVDEWDVHDSRHLASKCDRAKEFLMHVESEEQLRKAKHKIAKHCH